MADADGCPICKAGDTPSTKIMIPLLRKVMPNMIAADILSVQPMTGAMWPEMDWDCGLTFEHEVRFSSAKYNIFGMKNEVRMWALDNLRGLYTYRSLKAGSVSFLRTDDWVWSFQDPNDAVLFKVRWV